MCQKADLALVKPVVLRAAADKQQLSAALRLCGAINSIDLLREALGQIKAPLETPQTEQLKTIVKSMVSEEGIAVVLRELTRHGWLAVVGSSAAEVLDALVSAPQESARLPYTVICEIARSLDANGAALVVVVSIRLSCVPSSS